MLAIDALDEERIQTGDGKGFARSTLLTTSPGMGVQQTDGDVEIFLLARNTVVISGASFTGFAWLRSFGP